MEALEKVLHKVENSCGIPLGIGRSDRDVITALPILNVYSDMIDMVKQVFHEVDGTPDYSSAGIREQHRELLAENGLILYDAWTTSRQWRGHYWHVEVLKNKKTGRFTANLTPLTPPWKMRLNMLLNTGAQRSTYGLAEAETTAFNRLITLLSEPQRQAYILNDAFTEIGRSGLWYLLRKSRPTIAIRIYEENEYLRAGINPLCALCLHPLGYHEGTWAGVMAPSDEVLTHLLHIRADEHYFWRKANQISLDAMQSGI